MPEISVDTTIAGPGDVAVVTMVEQPLAVHTAIITGPRGPAGPAATQIVPIAYEDWPPVDPQPNVLYLKLAPEPAGYGAMPYGSGPYGGIQG